MNRKLICAITVTQVYVALILSSGHKCCTQYHTLPAKPKHDHKGEGGMHLSQKRRKEQTLSPQIALTIDRKIFKSIYRKSSYNFTWSIWR